MWRPNPRSLEQDRRGDDHHEHERHDPRHADDGEEVPAVHVAYRDHRGAGHRQQDDLAIVA
jgi:hypothetical protein